MARYVANGSLTTDKKTINDSDGWDSQSDWEAYQSASQVEIVNGSVQLAEIPANVVDNWEDSNLAEWSNTQNISVTSSNPLEQQYSVHIDSQLNDPGERPYSLSGGGLDYYPSKGDRFSALLIDGGANTTPGVAWAVATNTNGIDGYSVIHYPTNNELVVYRLDNGTNTELLRPSVTLASDQTYEYEVQWHDGSGSEADNTIEITVYETDESVNLSSELGRSSEVFNGTVSDSTHSGNDGVGLDNGSSSPGTVDRIDRYWHLGSVE